MKSPRLKFLLKWLLALAILILLYFIFTVINNNYHENRLAQLLNTLNSNEPGWQWIDRIEKLPQLKKEDNAAEEVKAITRLLTVDEYRGKLGRIEWSNDFFAFELDPVAERNREFLRDHPNAQLPRIYLETMKKLLTSAPCPEALQRARQLKRYSAGLFQHTYRPILSMSLLPDVQCVRNLVKLLSWNAALELEANRPEQAADDIRAMLQIARVFDHDPFTICMLVRSALVQMSCHATHLLLAQSAQISPSTLERLQKEFLREETLMTSLSETFRWERALHDHDLKLLHSGKYTLTEYLEQFGSMFILSRTIITWPWLDTILKKAFPASVLGWWGQPRHFAAERADQLIFYDKVLTWAASPEHQLLDNFKTMQQQGPGLSPFVYSLQNFNSSSFTLEEYKRNSYQGIDRIARAVLTYRAHCRSIATALASERYRLDHNAWPATWEQLTPHYLPRILLDPFTGKPLILKTIPDGLAIYSVGINGVDDNGKIVPADKQHYGDIGYRLWNPKERRIDMSKEFKAIEDELKPKN